MVRNLLGNIKGPKGEGGQQGDKGIQGLTGKDGIDVYSVPRHTQLFDKNDVLLDYTLSLTTGELIENVGFYSSNYIPVLPGGTLMVLPTVGQSVFYDKEYNFVSSFTSAEPNPISIPVNARYLITTGHQNSLDTKMVYIGTETLEYQNYIDNSRDTPLFSTNRLEFNVEGFPVISTYYDEVSNISYTFGNLGVNNIYHLRRIKTDYFDHVVSSDHISPYRIRAVNNPIADNPIFVTGGNHGTDGGAGQPTGKPVSIETFIDNKKVENGVHHTNSPIIVKVVNDACGYNTVDRVTGERRDILRETIVYTFYQNVMTVSIDMSALENLEFYGHRGISLQKHTHNYYAYVALDPVGRKLAADSWDFNSSTQGNTSTRMVLESESGDLVVMFTDDRHDLGNFELNQNDPRWFMTTTKAYCNTIEQNTFYQLGAGNSLILSGGYYYGKSLSLSGLSRGYYIMRGGKRVYCIDDFYGRSGHLLTKTDDIDKEVRVLQTVGYTVDDFVTSKGVKFSKNSGTGTIMFETL